MASFFIKSFFIFITILLSTQTHARESYFFHKLQRDNISQDKTSSEDVLPKKQQQPQQDEEQQDPRFVPESQNGYGLYGHDTTYNNNNKYEENVNYEPYNTPSLSQTEEESYNYDKYNEKYNNKKYYNSNAYGKERSYGNDNDNNNNNVEMSREGMSDTRFMENGKYYFDVNDDKNHGELYKKRYNGHNNNYDGFGHNININNNNNYEENRFQDPYNSKWENNYMVNEQEQEEGGFGEESRDQFVP